MGFLLSSTASRCNDHQSFVGKRYRESVKFPIETAKVPSSYSFVRSECFERSVYTSQKYAPINRLLDIVRAASTKKPAMRFYTVDGITLATTTRHSNANSAFTSSRKRCFASSPPRVQWNMETNVEHLKTSSGKKSKMGYILREWSNKQQSNRCAWSILLHSCLHPINLR